MTNTNCQKICDEMELTCSDSDIAILKNVCYLVSDRAAKLVAISEAQLFSNKFKIVINNVFLLKFSPSLFVG